MANINEIFEFLEADNTESNSARTTRKRRRLEHRQQSDPFSLDDGEFIKRYRLTKGQVRDLCDELRPHMPNPKKSTDLSVETKVLIALSFYATGSYQRPTGSIEGHYVAQQTVSTVIAQVTACLNVPELREKYIKFPVTDQERNRIKIEFNNKFHIPGVLGCIDCTHVAIVQPELHAERYFCRKQYHSLNVQLICDANMQIMSVDASNPGATHDSYVWSTHPLNARLQNLSNREETWLLDCVHLQLYKDLKERQKNGQTKASLSLEKYLGIECGFTLDKESNTLAILCEDVVPVLAFDTREILIQWRVKVQHNLGSSKEFSAVIISSPSTANIKAGPVRLHACGPRLALIASRPPEIVTLWDVKLLRRYGVVDKRFCVEGGSRCGRGEGLFVFAAEGGRELTELLNMHGHEAQSRLSIASRSGSALEKRFSDVSSVMDECFHSSLRSVSPSWAGPASQTMHCLSDLDTSMDSNEDKFRRPTSLPRCSSCIGKISHLTRSSTMNTPGSIMSPVWTMDNILEKRSDSDRASIYSRSSGSASEYSVPRSSCLLDKSFDSKRGSPIACCTPTVPVKTGGNCQCWQQVKPCCCRKKSFSGPYENYDVPKTPMPLIQEHPVDHTDASSLYDTPKKLKCLLNGQACACTQNDTKNNLEAKEQTDNNNTCDTSINNNEQSHSNYVNVTPVTKKPIPEIDFGNYANIDLTTLEKFETSLSILRNAGFSQEELDALEDIPEHDDDISTATTNTVHPSAECCNDHSNYMPMEPLEISLSSNSNKNSDNISRISHVSDPTQHSESDTISTRRSSSADFTKRLDDEYGINSQICFTPSVLRKAIKSDRINEGIPITLEIVEPKDKFKVPEPKNESMLVTKFRDAVKIRRSSSVPSKSEKNRDSSSSNDSGVSTGSLKHHKGDFNEFEMPITSSKSIKKHIKQKQARKSLTPVHTFVKSTSSDPLKNLTFQFEEVATLTKSNSCDVDTLTRRKKRPVDTDATARHSAMTTKSTSSGASDTSDYMESLSVSSFSSCDVSADRHITRPRSGKEYASIDRAALASVCDVESCFSGN